jgi:YjbE family integral membrane protein
VIVEGLGDPRFWLGLLEIGFLNLLLSGDNALVIALAVRALPPRPRLLGQIWGAFGAVVLRLIFVGIVSYLLRLVFLRLVGGAVLVWIAAKLVQSESGAENEIRHGASLWDAIWIIIVADVTMSLDNVLAIAAAAHGDMLLIVLGIALSLPIVIWGAGLLARLMNRYAWIVWLGGGVLGYVAGEMILEDPVVVKFLGSGLSFFHYPFPLVLGAFITALGWWLAQTSRPRHRVPEKL